MHQGSAGIRGTAVDVEIQAENLEYTKALMIRLIAEHTGQDLATIAGTPTGTGGSPPNRRATTVSSIGCCSQWPTSVRRRTGSGSG
jgi:hypothetical protein